MFFFIRNRLVFLVNLDICGGPVMLETQGFRGLWKLKDSRDCGHLRTLGIVETQEFRGLWTLKDSGDSGNSTIPARPKWALGPNGPGAQMGPGPKGPWGRAGPLVF